RTSPAMCCSTFSNPGTTTCRSHLIKDDDPMHTLARRFGSVLGLFCFLLLATSSFAQTPPVRIMPLGDSITDGTAYGTAGVGGYRGPLYTLLTNAGFNVDYIGTLTNNGASIPDHNHEGHSGW